MLRYILRVRDLVHGTILFTEEEQNIINHPLFQRLRQIRQNDVAFYVYPSLNTSRFEHVLGTCRVAGMMAEHLTTSPKWKAYLRQLKSQTGITAPEGFVELTRLYALLHDVGHLPLSHLFELAVELWAPHYHITIEEWTGTSGFEKIHEALGAVIAAQMLDGSTLPDAIRRSLTRLLTEKKIPPDDPLSVVKSIVDAEIDADRIDSIQRDGVLAGGEYGHYDIRRLADSIFIEKDKSGWMIAYSEAGLTSMEALLLDRYRAHVWIHYHHRVVLIKALVRHLIIRALEQGVVTKDDFNPANVDAFALKDDVWLWQTLRQMPAGDTTTELIKRAVLFREKRHVVNLWKNRPAYHELYELVEHKARVTTVHRDATPAHLNHLMTGIGVHVLWFDIPFKPTGEQVIPLYWERTKKLTGKGLLDVSRLVTDLRMIWEGEPQEFIVLVGENVTERADTLRQQWVDLTAQWIQQYPQTS